MAQPRDEVFAAASPEHIHLHGRKRSQHRTKASCARTFAGIRCTEASASSHTSLAMASGCVFAARSVGFRHLHRRDGASSSMNERLSRTPQPTNLADDVHKRAAALTQRSSVTRT